MLFLIMFFGNYLNNYFITRFILLAYSLSLFFYTFVLIMYYFKVHKCSCSNNWKKGLLLYPILLLIPLVLIILIKTAMDRKVLIKEIKDIN